MSLVLAVALVACAARYQMPAAAIAVPVNKALPQWRRWWAHAEDCAGKKFPYDSIAWFFVPATPEHPTGFPYAGDELAGLTFSTRRKIVLADKAMFDSSTVIHEALHVIASRGYHNPELYLRRCKPMVVCVMGCLTDTLPPRRALW